MTQTRTRTQARDEMAFADIETGGFGKQRPIIQVAVIAVDMAVDGWPETERIEVKIKFNPLHCNPDALKKNSYSAKVWAREALPTYEAQARLQSFFERHSTRLSIHPEPASQIVANLAGHNAHQFDRPRLVRFLGGAFPPFADWQTLDTLHLAREAQKQELMQKLDSNRLGDLCDYFDIRNAEEHDALGDIEATVKLAKALTGLMGGYRDELLKA